MKFYCDVCNTKYSISDEKVRGKVLKVRCKKCSNIITVREAVAPAGGDAGATAPAKEKTSPIQSSAPAPKASTAEVPKTNWHYSVNGQSSGPFSLAELRGKFKTGTLGDEAYVWHESIVQWKPVREVEAFRNALDAGHAVKPRSKTLGFTGPVEAIKAVDGPNKATEGAVPAGFGGAAAAAKETSAPEPDVREDRLAKLRDKLNVAPAASGLPKPKLESAPTPAVSETLSVDRDDLDDEDDSFASLTTPPEDESSTSSLSFAPGVKAAAPLGKTDVPRSQSDIALPSFDLPPAGSAARPDTSSTSDILDEDANPLPFGLSDEDEDAFFNQSADDSGVIPFFPEAPKLEGSHAAGAAGQSQITTGSLLIEIDQMKKEGRGKALFKFGAAVALLSIIVTAFIVMTVMAPKETKPLAVAKTDTKVVRELTERTYSTSKLKAFSNLTLEDDVIAEGEVPEDLEFGEDEVDAIEKGSAAPEKRIGTASRSGSKASTKKATTKRENKVASADRKKAAAEEKTAPTAEGAAGEQPAKELTARQKLLQYGRASGGGVTPEINRPADTLGTTGSLPKTLSKDDARKGFRRIRRSVMVCRERHSRRGGRFEDKKIKVSVVVNPDGRVDKVSTNSAGLAGTEFEKCMNSHRGRWRFAPWNGDPTEINSSFILQ